MYINSNISLESIKNKILYYPMAGFDFRAPIKLFRDFINEFWFVDCGYSFDIHELNRFVLRLSDMNLIEEEIHGSINVQYDHVRLKDYHSLIYV